MQNQASPQRSQKYSRRYLQKKSSNQLSQIPLYKNQRIIQTQKNSRESSRNTKKKQRDKLKQIYNIQNQQCNQQIYMLIQQNKILEEENKCMVYLLNKRKKIINQLQHKLGQQIEQQINNLQQIQQQKNKFLHQNALKMKDQTVRIQQLIKQINQLKNQIYLIKIKNKQDLQNIQQSSYRQYQNQLDIITSQHQLERDQMICQNGKLVDTINNQIYQIQYLKSQIKLNTIKCQELQQSLTRVSQQKKIMQESQERQSEKMNQKIKKLIITQKVIQEKLVINRQKQTLQVLIQSDDKQKHIQYNIQHQIYTDRQQIQITDQIVSKQFESHILQSQSISKLINHTQDLEQQKQLIVKQIIKCQLTSNVQNQINNSVIQNQSLQQQEEEEQEQQQQQLQLQQLQYLQQQQQYMKLKQQNITFNEMKNNYQECPNEQFKTSEFRKVYEGQISKLSQFPENRIKQHRDIETTTQELNAIQDEYIKKQLDDRDKQIQELQQKINQLNKNLKIHVQNQQKLQQNLRGLIQSQQRLRGMEQKKASVLGINNSFIKSRFQDKEDKCWIEETSL